MSAATIQFGASSVASQALTDTEGRLLLATVSTADLHDSHGGGALLRATRRLWPFLTHCFADQAYQGKRVGSITAITVEIVRPDKGQEGFAVQPRRWVIEGTFGWIARCRRLLATLRRPRHPHSPSSSSPLS